MCEDVDVSGDALLQYDETVELAGLFVRNFAMVELLVVCWLLALEESPEASKRFLTKEGNLYKRTERLKALVAADPTLSTSGLLAAIDDIGPLRELRNIVIHGAFAMKPDGSAVLLGYRRESPADAETMAALTNKTHHIISRLDMIYRDKFGFVPSLESCAKIVPQPTE